MPKAFLRNYKLLFFSVNTCKRFPKEICNSFIKSRHLYEEMNKSRKKANVSDDK